MSSLERSAKILSIILSVFDTPSINSCRTLQEASQFQVNIPSTGNKRKKTKFSRETHLLRTLPLISCLVLLLNKSMYYFIGRLLPLFEI